MARITPFRALHYDTTKINNISDVMTPPYDVISKDQVPKYLGRHPYNFAHLILPKRENDDYKEAAALLARWREHQILKKSSSPCYYLYRQTFSISGKAHVRDTLMCLVELKDFSQGIVRPHENTHGKYKADRLQILRETRTNLSHIFGMVKDPDGFLETTYEKWEYHPPLLHGTCDDGIEHTVWTIDGGKAPEISRFFEDKSIYIVDGHHRYESSLMYAREQNALGKTDHPANYMLFAIANSFDPGLVVLPTHRAISSFPSAPTWEKLEANFEFTPMTESSLDTFVQTPQKGPQFGFYWDSRLFLCRPKNWLAASDRLGKSIAGLSVAWSDNQLLRDICGIPEDKRSEHVRYEKDARALWESRKNASMIIFHAPPAITDITDVADEGKFMPQKSTFFYPKLAAGLIMRPLE